MCEPLFYPAEVREVFSLPDGWQPQGLLTVGYADRPGRLKSRKPVSEFVVFARDHRGRVPNRGREKT